MPIGDICVREVVTATKDTTVQQAAQLMRENHVGDLLIVEQNHGARRPIGIVTDRDIAVAVVALGLDPAALSVGEIMGPELKTVDEDEGIFETLHFMRDAGVRRVPVVDSENALVGVVSTDDIIQLLADEMTEVAKLISREQRREMVTRR